MKRTVLAVWLILAATVAQAAGLRVVDGDTVALISTIRLTGFDTPETHFARCAKERALGLQAAERLRQLAAGPVVISLTGRLDRYGRLLGSLTVAGEDAGQILIREGLAVPYTGRTSRLANHDWCA